MTDSEKRLVDIKYIVDMYSAGADTPDNAMDKIMKAVNGYEKRGVTTMKLVDLIKKHTLSVQFCGTCDCGEAKYDLITDDGLVYPPVHEVSIRNLRPELLKEVSE